MTHTYTYQPGADPNLDERGRLRKGLEPVGICLDCGMTGTEGGLERIACLSGSAARAATEQAVAEMEQRAEESAALRKRRRGGRKARS